MFFAKYLRNINNPILKFKSYSSCTFTNIQSQNVINNKILSNRNTFKNITYYTSLKEYSDLNSVS